MTKLRTKGYVLATAMSAFMLTAANAADLPVYKAPPTAPAFVPPPLTWAGFYAGVNGGAVWHRVTGTTTDYLESCYYEYDCYYGSYSNSHSKTKAGGTFGGQIGYNWQGGPWVYGVEADLNWVSAKVSGTRSSYDCCYMGYGSGVSGTVSSELTWLATIRGRLGYAWGPTMIYATGGVAFGGIKNSVSASIYDDFYTYAGFTQSKSQTRTGWTVGGGLEHMFSPHWTVKAEMLYVDLGGETLKGVSGGGCVGYYCLYGSTQTKIDHTAVIARVGVNYKW